MSNDARSADAAALFPAFLKLAGRKVVLVGGGRVAAAKHAALVAAGAQVTVVAPSVVPELRATELGARGTAIVERPFEDGDLDGAWYVVAAATPEVNRRVLAAAEARRIFVNAVDDPEAATAYAGALLRRGPVTIAISTGGAAPALAGLMREALEALVPPEAEIERWSEEARAQRSTWKAAAVPMSERRPQLLAALNRIYEEKNREQQSSRADLNTEGSSTSAPLLLPVKTRAASGEGGRVVLVGAGPGDPELLTLRGQRRLAEADLVLYDALTAPALAALKPLAPEARWFYVGKRARRESIRQEAINRIMIREARRGHVVVRLKGGDPFVLGRGGEEALALAAAGVACEVVPGVSAATAAPALAGIPVTHRGLASSFVVLAGHSEGAASSVLASLEPGSATLVVLMGLAARAEITRQLLARGWLPETPAALLFGAATPDAWCWLGRLDELATAEIPAAVLEADVPATIVVGSVVALARAISAGVENAA